MTRLWIFLLILAFSQHSWANGINVSNTDVADGINLGNVSALNNTANFSVSCKFRTSTTGVDQTIIAKREGSGSFFGWQMRITSGNKLRGFSSYSTNVIQIDSAASVTDGNVHTGTFVVSANSGTLYLDGASAGTDGSTGSINAQSASAYIGSLEGLADDFQGNYIGECYVFPGALTAADAALLASSNIVGIGRNLSIAPTSCWLISGQYTDGSALTTGAGTYRDFCGSNNGTGVDADADSTNVSHPFLNFRPQAVQG